MIRTPPPFAALSVLVLAALAACAKPAPPAPPPAPVVAAQPAPPPAKPMKMVCRDSGTGAKAECGTPGAVMVGMAPA